MNSSINLKTETGLSTQAAIARLNQDGPNELPSAQSRSLHSIAWDAIQDPIFLLLSAYAASFSPNTSLFGSFGLEDVHGIARCYLSKALHCAKFPESGTLTPDHGQISSYKLAGKTWRIQFNPQ